MRYRNGWSTQLRVFSCALLVITIAGCTTTTRSITESPRDPQVQRQLPASTPQSTKPATQPTRQPNGRPSAPRLTSRQMEQLSLPELEALLTRGHTRADQVAELFGRPHSTTRSGDEIYWNYTHQFRDERRNLGGLKSLTILFDEYGRISDYDFQDNSFNLQ